MRAGHADQACPPCPGPEHQYPAGSREWAYSCSSYLEKFKVQNNLITKSFERMRRYIRSGPKITLLDPLFTEGIFVLQN